MRHRYSKEQLIVVVPSSNSLGQVLKKLGVVAAGGNYQVLKKRIALFNIDTSHFSGKGWLKGKTHAYKLRPLDDILVYGKYENTHKLKNRLIRDGIKDKQCENCNLTEWLGEPIPLELHHIDGDKKNNRLENLALLCPNCHARTKNYRGKNKRPSGEIGDTQRT